ncbi:MAG TPA: DUF4282 domain-containing protein [Phenylobacterium sp.]|nr:DUF4282 domain-containing protein [Phenylobacterium sp.]
MASQTRSKRGAGASVFWDLLTFDRLMTNTVIHLIYWAGLGVIALGAFGTIGAAVGVALREESVMGLMLAIPVLVAGFLVVGALILLWRSFCEFYVAISPVGDVLQVRGQRAEAGPLAPPRPAQAATSAPPRREL